MRRRSRRKLRVNSDDPWIDIHRSGEHRQHDSDEDQKSTIIGVIVVFIILVWLFT